MTEIPARAMGFVARMWLGHHPAREFRTEFRGDLTGQWDQRRIRQALLNLIDNAVQHGSSDSAITVSASGDDARCDVVVSVHNLGTPIPDEARERVFQPFQRGDSAEAAGEGHHGRKGLGLYIARRMAEAHGGGLEVESSGEEGTTFSIRMPRNAANGSDG